jgi:hypothetical protein
MVNSERKNISQPADWWAAFEAQARQDRLTLSEWLGECAVANLPKSVRKRLSERPGAHRPRKTKDEGEE